MSSIKKGLLSNSAIVFAAKVAFMVGGVLVNAFWARMLSPSDMGIYFLFTSVVTFAVHFGELGTVKPVVRLVAGAMSTGDPARARSAIHTVLFIAAIASTISAVVLSLTGGWIFNFFFDVDTLGATVLLIAPWAFLWAVQNVLSECFRGFKSFLKAAITNRLLGTSLLAGVLAVLFFSGYRLDLGQAIGVTIMTLAVGVLLSVYMLVAQVRSLPKSDGSVSIKEVLNLSLPLFIVGLSPCILDQAGLWIIGAYCSPADVAIFAAAVRLIKLVTMPMLVMNFVLGPYISGFHAKGERSELEYYLRRTASLGGVFAFLVVGFMVVAGKQVLGIVYGDYYESGYVVMSIMLFGKLFNAWTGSCGLTLMMTGGERSIMIITVVSSITLFIGSILAVQSFGINGVAFVISGVTILQYAAMLLVAKKHTGCWTHMYLSPVKLWNIVSRGWK